MRPPGGRSGAGMQAWQRATGTPSQASSRASIAAWPTAPALRGSDDPEGDGSRHTAVFHAEKWPVGTIPHDRTRRTLTVLADLDTVRIVESNKVIATHTRSWDRGQQIEVPAHLQRLVAETKRARAHRGLDRLAKAVPSSQGFLRSLDMRNENIGSNTSRLLLLLDSVGADALEDALVEVLEHDTIHIGAVRQVLDRRRSDRGLPPPVTIPLAPRGSP